MEWVKKHGLLLCRIVCILSFTFIVFMTINQKKSLQKELSESKSLSMEYEKLTNQLTEQHKKVKDELQKVNEENTLLDDKIQLLQEKLNEEKKNNEEVVLQVNTLKDNNNILEEKLKEKSSEVRTVIVDERIPESLIEFILEISDALEEKNYKKFLSYWDLSHEYVDEFMAEYWYKECVKGGYITTIRFYDQYGTGKGSITDDYFAVRIDMDNECSWILAGGKKDDRWVLRFWD